MDEYTPERIAAEEARIDSEFEQGRCPWSGLDVHRCHEGVCDCFGAWNCKVCNG